MTMAIYVLNQPEEFDFVVRTGWAASDQNFVPARIPTYGCNVCCSLGNFVANSAKISHLRDSRFGILLSPQKVEVMGAAGLVCEPQNFYIKKLRDCAAKRVLALYKEGELQYSLNPGNMDAGIAELQLKFTMYCVVHSNLTPHSTLNPRNLTLSNSFLSALFAPEEEKQQDRV